MSYQFALKPLMVMAACALYAPWHAANAAPSPPTISSFSPHKGPVGATVVINGTQFVPPLSIVFGGGREASGSFSSTKITVTVPSGATSGPIQVNTAGGSVSTNKPFRVSKQQAIARTFPSPSVLLGPMAGGPK